LSSKHRKGVKLKNFNNRKKNKYSLKRDKKEPFTLAKIWNIMGSGRGNKAIERGNIIHNQ
jgi:hypothetical protein